MRAPTHLAAYIALGLMACAPGGMTSDDELHELLDPQRPPSAESRVPLLVAADDPPFQVDVPDDQPERMADAVLGDPRFAPLADALREAGLADDELAGLVAEASVDRTGHPADRALAQWRADRREVVLSARDFLDAIDAREVELMRPHERPGGGPGGLGPTGEGRSPSGTELGEIVDRDALDRATALLSVAALPVDDERGAP
ncbi:MAG: hypothetical protein KF901_10895 [Myxococcales bacterium]|nr:hypothetical protein [Myxococcales bacterium]